MGKGNGDGDGDGDREGRKGGREGGREGSMVSGYKTRERIIIGGQRLHEGCERVGGGLKGKSILCYFFFFFFFFFSLKRTHYKYR